MTRALSSTSICFCGCNQGRAVMLERGRLLAQALLGLLRLAKRAEPAFHQGVVAAVVLPGEAKRGRGRGDVGAGLVDDRLLQGDLGIDVADIGFSRRHLRLGLIESGAEILIVDPGQDLTGLDRLVVGHQHIGDVARDPGRDGRVVGLQIGIVGRFLETAHGPIVIAPISAAGAGDDDARLPEPHA